MGFSPTRVIACAPVSPNSERRAFFFIRGRAALAIALTVLSGCRTETSDGPTVGPSVIDDAGRSVPVGSPARRVISTLPNTTELIVALGATDRLVARTDFDLDPRLEHLPSLGRTLQPSTEAILALSPDLVIVGTDLSGYRILEHLESLGAPVYVANVDRIEGIYSTTERLGRLLGLPERAGSLVAELKAGLEEARGRYAAGPRPTVLYVVWHDPPHTTGPRTFIDEVIAVAGGVNVFHDLGTPWSSVSIEEILYRDPDYIVIPRGDGHSVQPQWLRDLAGWRDVGAVREHRLITVDSDLFNRPGTRVVEAANVLGRALHPGTKEVRP